MKQKYFHIMTKQVRRSM